MSRPFSIYLDLMRFGAAFVVLLSHMAYKRFTGADWLVIRDYNVGSDAVVLFFVLSGFVIAYTTDAKMGKPGGDLRGYMVSRLSRLYSVAFPAIVLGLAIDALGASIDWPAYDGWWYGGENPVWRAIISLTFSNELWGNGVRPGTNGPFWSVTYEFWYYMLFAAAMFLRGWRRVFWVGVIALISGPKILLLLPAWLLGVWVWRMISRPEPAISNRTAVILILAGPALYVACQAVDLPRNLMALNFELFGKGFIRGYLRFSDEFVWNNLLALLVAVHFLGAAQLLRGRKGPSKRMEAVLRWPSGYTFALYLFHYPLIMFYMSALALDRYSTLDHFILLGATCGTCFLLGAVTEKRKGPYDRFFRWLFSRFGNGKEVEKASPGPAKAALS